MKGVDGSWKRRLRRKEQQQRKMRRKEEVVGGGVGWSWRLVLGENWCHWLQQVRMRKEQRGRKRRLHQRLWEAMMKEDLNLAGNW